MDLIGITKGNSTYDIKDTTARHNIDVIVDVLNGLSQDVSLISGGIIKLNADPSTLTPTEEQIGQIGTYNGEQYRAVSELKEITPIYAYNGSVIIFMENNGSNDISDYVGANVYEIGGTDPIGVLIHDTENNCYRPDTYEDSHYWFDDLGYNYDDGQPKTIASNSWKKINWEASAASQSFVVTDLSTLTPENNGQTFLYMGTSTDDFQYGSVYKYGMFICPFTLHLTKSQDTFYGDSNDTQVTTSDNSEITLTGHTYGEVIATTPALSIWNKIPTDVAGLTIEYSTSGSKLRATYTESTPADITGNFVVNQSTEIYSIPESVVQSGSTRAVSGDAVSDALETKQDTVIYDRYTLPSCSARWDGKIVIREDKDADSDVKWNLLIGEHYGAYSSVASTEDLKNYIRNAGSDMYYEWWYRDVQHTNCKAIITTLDGVSTQLYVDGNGNLKGIQGVTSIVNLDYGQTDYSVTNYSNFDFSAQNTSGDTYWQEMDLSGYEGYGWRNIPFQENGMLKLTSSNISGTASYEYLGQIGVYNGERYEVKPSGEPETRNNQYIYTSTSGDKQVTFWTNQLNTGATVYFELEPDKWVYGPYPTEITVDGETKFKVFDWVFNKDADSSTTQSIDLYYLRWTKMADSAPQQTKTVTGTGCSVSSNATDYFVIHTNSTTTLAYYILGNKVQHVCGRLVETSGFGLYDYSVSNGVTTFSISTPANTKTTVVALGENVGNLTIGAATAQSPWGVTYSDAIDQQARVEMQHKQDQFTWETNETDLVLSIQHTAGSKSKLLVETWDAILIIEDNQGGDLVTPNVVVTPINEAAITLYDGQDLEIGGITTSGYILTLNGITTAKLIPLDGDTYNIGEDTTVSPDTTHVSRTTHVSEVLITCTADQYAALKATGGPGINPRAMYLVTDENPSSGTATLTPMETYNPSTEGITFNSETMHD